MGDTKNIQVYAHWKGLPNPALMGILYSERLNGKEFFSFSYTKEWLDSGYGQFLDPALQLYSGPQYPDVNKNNFGIFLDSSPDRWDRLLIRIREAVIARMENRNDNNLFETDYLLGVFDGRRMGGVRFKYFTKLIGTKLNKNRKNKREK